MPPPQLIYGENKTIVPNEETFKWNNVNFFLLPADIQKWGMFLLDDTHSRHQFKLPELR